MQNKNFSFQGTFFDHSADNKTNNIRVPEEKDKLNAHLKPCWSPSRSLWLDAVQAVVSDQY